MPINANQRISYKPIGDRRHLVTFQRALITTDSFNRQITTWPDYATESGAIAQVPVVVSELDASVFRVIEIPYRSDIKVDDRVIVDDETGTPLKVVAIVNPEQKYRCLQVHCAEVRREPIGWS